MSVVGLEESEKIAKSLQSNIKSSLIKQRKEIQAEIDKIEFLLNDKNALKSWKVSQADDTKVASLLAQLNEVEKLYIEAGDTTAGKIFKDRMKKELQTKLTNLQANKVEVAIRTQKFKAQTQNKILDDLTKVRQNGATRELYLESRNAGGFLSNIGRSYMQDLVTLETKAAGSKTLGQYMSKLYDTYEKGLKDVFVSGIVRGDSYSQMIKNLMKKTDVTVGKANILVRTEANAIFNDSVKNVIQKNPLVKGYRFRAVLDSRTSDICQEHDGEYIAKDDIQPGINYPPLHPNCRSTVTTVLVSEDEKKDTMQRYTKNGSNDWIKVPVGMTYKQFKQQFSLASSLPTRAATQAASEIQPQIAERISAQELRRRYDERIANAAKLEEFEWRDDHKTRIEKMFAQVKMDRPAQIVDSDSMAMRRIKDYTVTSYSTFNSLSESIYNGKPISSLDAFALDDLDLVSSSLYKASLHQDARITRNVKAGALDGYMGFKNQTRLGSMLSRSIDPNEGITLDQIAKEVNDLISDENYLDSVADNLYLDRPTSATFVEDSFGATLPLELEMLAPKGTPGMPLEEVTEMPSEYEFLIPPGVKYRPLRAVASKKKHRIILQIELLPGEYKVPELLKKTFDIAMKGGKK